MRYQASSRQALRALPVWLALLVMATTVRVARADFDEHVSLSAHSLLVANLAGAYTVRASDGPNFEVDIAVRGKDGTRDNIRIEQTAGSDAKLIVRYPLERQDHFIYERGRGNTTIEWDRDGDDEDHWVADLFGEAHPHRVRVSNHGAGLSAYADITVRVPKGAHLTTGVIVGTYQAAALEAALTHSTMSGDASVQQVRGDVSVGTGSGDLELSDVTGAIDVHSGSGDIDLTRTDGSLMVNTGSGSVNIFAAKAPRLAVDTGSGDVRARGVEADGAKLGTGSGSLELALSRMGTGRFELGTGSGGIVLRVPSGASAAVTASTSSGRVHIDVEDAVVEHLADEEAEFRLGDGAARVKLQTASGSIRVTR